MYPRLELTDFGYRRPGREEPEGTKKKFWVQANQELAEALGIRRDQKVLFKFNRPTPCGEDWAEKVASELAALLGLPAARVELATFRGARGILSPSFLARPQGHHTDLVLGNRLLFEDDPDYPAPGATGRIDRREPRYTVEAAAGCLAYRDIEAPDGSPPGLDGVTVFAGYLLLDAWIANTDRHHGNWGVTDDVRRLAPSFDHAASLGQGLGDPARERRLAAGSGQGSIESFVRSSKARSCFFEEGNDPEPISMLRAWRVLRERLPAADHWSQRLGSVPDAQVRAVLERVPGELTTVTCREFTYRLLECTRSLILGP